MGWRSERQERRERRDLRRASRHAEGALISTINLVGLGIGLAILVVVVGAQLDIPAWLVALAAVLAAVPAAMGLRQPPRTYRQHRDAKRRLP